MRYIHTTIQVRDLKKSLAFYQDLLGLAVVRGTTEGRGPVFLGEADKPVIELIAGGTGGEAAFGGVSVGFEVDSLEEATRKLEAAGCPRIRGPISPNPQLAFSFFRDPDGMEIQLLEYLRP
ncbi:MAG: VOC family protein [Spirochaetaceae bacterium]|jgi:catechol 2,3-dioxygenase-like lactoylglutathione lyase family enzyme|nr:VOC family protein [Spirochaetaceae bacterium]